MCTHRDHTTQLPWVHLKQLWVCECVYAEQTARGKRDRQQRGLNRLQGFSLSLPPSLPLTVQLLILGLQLRTLLAELGLHLVVLLLNLLQRLHSPVFKCVVLWGVLPCMRVRDGHSSASVRGVLQEEEREGGREALSKNTHL